MLLEIVVRLEIESRWTLAWSNDSFQAGQSSTHQHHFPLSIMTIDGDKRYRFPNWTQCSTQHYPCKKGLKGGFEDSVRLRIAFYALLSDPSVLRHTKHVEADRLLYAVC